MKIGIIGVGVIGRAVMSVAKSRGVEVLPVDPALDQTYTLEGMLAESLDAIFVCLPTPSKPSGECDVSILEQVLVRLVNCEFPIIVHSTAPWKFYNYWASRVKTLVHVPEFITAADAEKQYANQQRVIIGGTSTACTQASTIVDQVMRPATMEYMSIGEAAFVKYLSNSYLATKVVYMNQMAELANACGLNWNAVAEAAKKDPRLGTSHWQVPGPDGQSGYGGMCFPKDVDSLLSQSDDAGIGLSLLEEAKKANIKLRRV